MQRLLSDGFAQISGVIRAHGGVVEKYIGDAILGTFGIPVARPDDAERALRAADACMRWASEWAAASGGLGLRAGLETGDLLVDPRALETQQRTFAARSGSGRPSARGLNVSEPGRKSMPALSPGLRSSSSPTHGSPSSPPSEGSMS